MAWWRTAALAVALAATAGCGGGGPRTEPRTPAPDPGGDVTVFDRLAGAGLQPLTVVEAVCEHWGPADSERATVSQYVFGLLRSETFVPGEPPVVTEARLDVAVRQACRDHPDEPASFLAAVTAGVGLTEADLTRRVDDACRRYEKQRRGVASGNWSGDDLAPLVREIAASRAVPLPALRAAIAQVCGFDGTG